MTRRLRVYPGRPGGSWWRVTGVALAAVVMLMAMLGEARAARAGQLTPQQKQDMKLHYERATRAYDLGKYQEAIDEYQKAYEISGDSAMLYNIAQAYRLNDQPEEAVHFYRRYLTRRPEAKNRDDVDRKIAEMEKQIEEKQKKAAEAPAPAPVTPPLPVVPPVPVVAPPPPVVVAPLPVPIEAPSHPRLRKAIGWTLVGVGVIAGGVAIFEGLEAKKDGDDLTNLSNATVTAGPRPMFNPSTESSGKTANTLAIAFGISGTAIAVAGAVVLITTHSAEVPAPDGAEAQPTNVSFAPWIAPGLVGGGAGLRF